MTDRAQLKAAAPEIARLDAQLRRLTADQTRQEAVLRQDRKRRGLETSLFPEHAALPARASSWEPGSLPDLEKTVP